ncbi:glycosyltransferase family 1 protein [Sulfurimonas sp.]|jgi:glycosyltransferase involved in cell wall biosynthesis|uniref:glycosyltransferase family 4 protein n=1 Tax=Sulfurimonas sp. TaxID=2022749 RepID=UPI002A35D85A|nr:glycosyltransferase family 1 protein [Sulfurimonas sp.]MDY0122978.1 glycosyltransferase family 1 protein [Sulfurimonas sp.]
MKKILIDAVSLLSPLTGIGRYTYEVSSRLQKLSTDKYEIFFNYGYHSKELYGLSNNQSTAEQKAKKLQLFIKKFPFFKKISRYIYTYMARFYQTTYDLYFQPSFIPNLNIKTKKLICTVHDFSFKLQPQWHPKERIEYFNENFDLVKKADHIITGSNFTKQEIIDYMQMPQDKISVIYHGVNHGLYKLYPQNELQETKAKFSLPKKFLLFVGSIEPRKNLLTLLKAYNLLANDEKGELPLILVGFKGWENQEIMQEIEKNRDFIRYLGFVSDSELAHIYNLAAVFIYPSLYEGFGLPPLEAMACGTPVIVSDVASLPEVCGDAAFYVEPTDSIDIKNKILAIAKDEKLREELSQKSKAQAALFSWDKAAQEHLKVIESLLETRF